MEQISASPACAYGRGHIIYAVSPRPCSRGLRGGRLDGKRVKAEVVLFLASLRDGGACLTLDIDPNHPLTALLCCSRAPLLVVRGRTQAHGCCLRHTHAPPHTTPLPNISPVQGRPATTTSLRPASLTTAHHPSACPSLCSTLRCAINSNNTRRYPGVENSSQAVWKVEEEHIGELLRERVYRRRFPVLLPERTKHLHSETAA